MRRYRSYKFTNKHHSKGGVRSSIAGAVSLVCTLIGVYGAYKNKGDGGTYLALCGVIAIVCCVYGVLTGNRSFQEEEVYYIFSRIGTALNCVLVIFWIAVCGMGILI